MRTTIENSLSFRSCFAKRLILKYIQLLRVEINKPCHLNANEFSNTSIDSCKKASKYCVEETLSYCLRQHSYCFSGWVIASKGLLMTELSLEKYHTINYYCSQREKARVCKKLLNNYTIVI